MTISILFFKMTYYAHLKLHIKFSISISLQFIAILTFNFFLVSTVVATSHFIPLYFRAW